MKVVRPQTFTGPNQFVQEPAIVFAVKGMAAARNGFNATLIETVASVLPDLKRHTCFASMCAHTDSVPERNSNHFFAHICHELQTLAGCQLTCLHTQCFHHGKKNTVVISYENAEVGAAAASLACKVVDWALAGKPEATIQKQLGRFLRAASAQLLPVQDRALRRRAHELDIPTYQISGRVLAFGQGRLQKRLNGTKTTMTNVISNDLAANKDYSRQVLGRLALPVPRYARVRRSSAALIAANDIGFPLVVKPNNGGMGRGVTVGVKNIDEFREAYARAKKFDHSVLVEEIISGADYRLLVVNGEVCAAAKRVPGHITGDGRRTVLELLEEVNNDPRRGTGPTASWTKIALDDQALRLITELDYTTESVPPEGEVIYLRRNANTSDGGTAIDVTDEVHPDNKRIAVRAAKAIGLDIAGVDILSEDIGESMWANGGRICEINSRPGIRKHMWPSVGQGRDVTTPILTMLFGEQHHARIPVVAVFGAGDTDPVARLVADQLERAGHQVGLSLREPPARDVGSSATVLSGRQSPLSIALDPDVDVMVIALDAARVVTDGLEIDAIDVALVVDQPGNGLPGKAAQKPITRRNLARGMQVVSRTTRQSIVVDPSSSLMTTIQAHSIDAQVVTVNIREYLRELGRTVLRGEPKEEHSTDDPDWIFSATRLGRCAGILPGIR